MYNHQFGGFCLQLLNVCASCLEARGIMDRLPTRVNRADADFSERVEHNSNLIKTLKERNQGDVEGP